MVAIVLMLAFSWATTSIVDKAITWPYIVVFIVLGVKLADQIAYSDLICRVGKPQRRFWQIGPLSYGLCNLTGRGDDVDLLLAALPAEQRS